MPDNPGQSGDALRFCFQGLRLRIHFQKKLLKLTFLPIFELAFFVDFLLIFWLFLPYDTIEEVEAKMSDMKKTMTLNLTEREMEVLEELSRRKDLSKTAVLRQALRLYQLVDARLAAGEKLFFEDERAAKKAELMVL